jgi:hypothetical protein
MPSCPGSTYDGKTLRKNRRFSSTTEPALRHESRNGPAP